MGLRVGPAVDDLAQATEYAQILQELLQIPCGMSDFEVATPLLELEPWQVVDARDMAAWLLDCAQAGTTGTYDTVGPVVPRMPPQRIHSCNIRR